MRNTLSPDEFFERDIHAPAITGVRSEHRTVRLVTTSPSSHMNVVIKDAPIGVAGKTHVCACLKPDEVKALRDALIEAYPLEEKQVDMTPTPYKVRDMGRVYSGNRYVVERMAPQMCTEFHSSASDAVKAHQIADLLNGK